MTGTNTAHTKVFNRRVVLEAIRLYGPISRADLARRTSLMFQTVSNIVAEYKRDGLVRSAGRTNGARGQPATLIELNSEAAFTFGFQLDRNQVRGTLVDLAGRVRASEVVWCDKPTPDFAFPAVRDMAQRLCATAGIQFARVLGAGLALPGPLDPIEHTTAALDHPGWEAVPLKARFEEVLGVPVDLERDAVAAALGERLHGDGRRYANAFCIFFGIGLGGGMILDGQPYRGRSGYAAEIGHYLSEPGGRLCSCGSRGCLETYVSLGALFDSLGIARHSITAVDRLRQLAATSDPALDAWLDEAASRLVGPMVMLDNVLGMEAVFFGGFLPKVSVRRLIGRLDALLPGYRMRGKRSYPKMLPATSGENAAALGAAVLPVFERLAPTPKLLLKQPETKLVDEPGLALVT